MPEVTQHQPGSFCWIELGTSDPPTAKKFYSDIFGWQTEDMPSGPDSVYTMLKLRGLEVGALYKLNQEQTADGALPHWMSYVAVASADETAARAKSLGGTLRAEPFDVMDVGRMAVIQDPQGAILSIWQAKRHIGTRLADESGTFCWNELWTPDPRNAREFYTGLFGWVAKPSGGSGAPDGYTEWATGGRSIGGMLQIEPQMGPVPPSWLPYFIVDSCDASSQRAQAAGGTAQIAPMDIPNVGRFAVLRDPQGAMFAIINLTGSVQ
jgi:predicted enzyme related to lactoylglutathione lyase